MSYVAKLGGLGQSNAGYIRAMTYPWATCGGGDCGNVAPPPVPTPGQLASDDAAGVVSEMVNQQMADQQALNAAGVQETLGSELGGAVYNAGEAIGAGLSSAAWIAAGVLALAVVILARVR